MPKICFYCLPILPPQSCRRQRIATTVFKRRCGILPLSAEVAAVLLGDEKPGFCRAAVLGPKAPSSATVQSACAFGYLLPGSKHYPFLIIVLPEKAFGGVRKVLLRRCSKAVLPNRATRRSGFFNSGYGSDSLSSSAVLPMSSG